MSFCKAKLHRFNDDKPCAPPPGAYNPATVNKTVGPIINRTERFADNKQMIHASSTESVNSLQSEKGTSCTGSFSTFKTPRIPSTFRSISQTDVRRKCDFSHQKAVSTDFINKKSIHNDYKLNSLTCSLNMMQEELTTEKDRHQQLLDELVQVKENTTAANAFSKWLVDVISEKDSLIDLLQEKCRTLQSFASKYIESYQEYVKSTYCILETHYKMSSKADIDLTSLVERYETLVSEQEQDLDTIFVFLVDLLRKQNNVVFEGVCSDDSTEQCSKLVGILKETERSRRKYEIIVQEMQKVISVLSGRVHESDTEVDRMYEVVAALTEEKTKLRTEIHDKEEEISAMRNIIETLNKNFANEVRDVETGLLNLVDEFKEKATTEKQNYEHTLHQKDLIIADLARSRNTKELQLQESLDHIQLLKCKEEILHTRLDEIQTMLRDKCCTFEDSLQQCHQRLVQWEAMADEMQVAKVKTSDICAVNSVENADDAKAKNNDFTAEPVELMKKLVEFMTQNQLLPNEQVEKLNSVENFTEFTNILGDILSNTSNDGTDEISSVQHLLKVVFNTFNKLGCEFSTLQNDLSRLRDDFSEKCDECAQLTRLLQLSEKQVEVSEQNTFQLESCQNKCELQITQHQQKIDSLNTEKIDLQQQLSGATLEAEQRQHDIAVLREQMARLQENLAKQNVDDENNLTSKLENTIKEEQTKREELVKQNDRLLKLIGPYRQVLEKYEAESKISGKKNDSNAVTQKYLKSLNQQNQDLKMKQIMKSKNEISQMRKKKEDQSRKHVPKTGKENKVMPKNKEIPDVRRAMVAEVPVNATYIVTSPKVNRI